MKLIRGKLESHYLFNKTTGKAHKI